MFILLTRDLIWTTVIKLFVWENEAHCKMVIKEKSGMSPIQLRLKLRVMRSSDGTEMGSHFCPTLSGTSIWRGYVSG